MTKKIGKFLGVFIAFAMLVFAIPSSAAPSVAPSFGDTYDFFSAKYQKLAGQSHVFQTAEFAEVYHYFLGGRYNKGTDDFTTGERSYNVNVKDGNHIFLFGGAWSPEMQAAIGYINDVAKEYGITAIYNFDPHLDGAGADSVIDIFADPGAAPAEDASDADKELYNTHKAFSLRGDALAKRLVLLGRLHQPGTS